MYVNCVAVTATTASATPTTGSKYLASLITVVLGISTEAPSGLWSAVE